MSVATKGIFIVAAKRTPFGTFGGKFTNTTATDLQVVASKSAIQAAGVAPEQIDSVVIGNVQAASAPDGGFLPRHTLLKSGIPLDRPALGVNRLCGSGFQAVVNAAQNILVGESKIVLAGGAENMSQAPFVVRDIRFGIPLGKSIEFQDTLWTGLTDTLCNTAMGGTAENLGAKYGITRAEVDAFSLRSQVLWKEANAAGRFKEEIEPVKVTAGRKEVIVDVDEHPRPETTAEGLAKLKSIFKKDGLVTAGTASGISDGAGALIVAGEEAVKAHGLKPLARIVGYSIVGVEPTIMGIGPAPAIKNLLKVTGKSLNDIDLVEINEAFAAQVLACAKDLGLEQEKLNVNGGAVALGHPLAASGARITTHLVHELRRRKAKFGIGSACIGGGQGIALLIESL